MHSMVKYAVDTHESTLMLQLTVSGPDILKKNDLHKLITNRILKIIDRTPFYSIGRIGIYTFLHSLPLSSLFFLSLSKPISLSLGAL